MSLAHACMIRSSGPSRPRWYAHGQVHLVVLVVVTFGTVCIPSTYAAHVGWTSRSRAGDEYGSLVLVYVADRSPKECGRQSFEGKFMHVNITISGEEYRLHLLPVLSLPSNSTNEPNAFSQAPW